MPSSLGPAEILVILVVALIVLGPNRLPEAGRQVGRALAEVRKWTQGMQSELRDAIETEPPRAPAPAPVASGTPSAAIAPGTQSAPIPSGTPPDPAPPVAPTLAPGTAAEWASILPPPEPPVVAAPSASDDTPDDAPPTPSGEGTVGEPSA